jgi:hypothetical protein
LLVKRKYNLHGFGHSERIIIIIIMYLLSAK